jgi:hypothetical protein
LLGLGYQYRLHLLGEELLFIRELKQQREGHDRPHSNEVGAARFTIKPPNVKTNGPFLSTNEIFSS